MTCANGDLPLNSDVLSQKTSGSVAFKQTFNRDFFILVINTASERGYPRAMDDQEVVGVISALANADPGGVRFARTLRRTFDQIHDGQPYGAFSLGKSQKTEKLISVPSSRSTFRENSISKMA